MQDKGPWLAAKNCMYSMYIVCTGVKINIGKFTGCMAYLEPIKLEFT